jgi:2-methylisocitrate lyase-like PEP mutase family enzyme
VKEPSSDDASAGARLRRDLARGITPFIGIYDVFSALLTARHYDALFVSGFGFAASYYGLPDRGFTSVFISPRRLRARGR